ncbi:MAG: ThuA domain-containing protein [Cyclobacteriaceae bacterium]
MTTTYVTLLTAVGLFLFGCHSQKTAPESSSPHAINILFLGHDSEHHDSENYMPLLASALYPRGIAFSYTEDPNDLNPENLAKYDGLLIYANHDEITPAQDEALLEYVRSGKGFIPLHCASFCFRNSPEYVEMVGGQFLEHDTGTFVANIIQADHPALEGVEEFSTWDETYVHHEIAEDINVLMERVEGDHHEPWTWTKTFGEGRVFYTAYGHDERTWNQPEFHDLMEAGILWAVGDDAKEQWQAYMEDMPTLQYEDRDNIPNYEKRDPAPRYQLPLSPEESKKLIQVPVGFSLELFASEPDVINPISMEWDERGRLWVIETVDYPNTVRNEDGVGDDRIKICEDTDGDGKADKFTVFAEHLNIPTSLVFANGGIIVSQAPHFLFLQDTDGDDKADVRKEIITGWGTYDTHAGPSNLTYGLDNWIWGVVGYSGFKGTIAGETREFSQGVYRFAPDVSDFEYLTRTSNNTWGLGFTENFDVFASTANNTHSVYLGIPNNYLTNVDGLPALGSAKIDGHYSMQLITDRLRQVDVWGGFTAAAGHRFYTARSYPSEYWSQIAFVCEPTGHIVHQARIEKEGAGFVEKNGGNLFAGADEWVAPVEAKVGPDGAVWVADWYNFIVQHNPTPTPDRGGYEAQTGEGNAYVNPLRDRQHGRIWRVVYNESEPYEPMTLGKDDPEALLAALSSENMFWRTTAQRLLVERGEDDVLPELYRIIKKTSTDNLGMTPGAVHALWTLHGLGALDGTNEEAYRIAVNALYHPAAGVRRAAAQVMPSTPWANQAILRSNLAEDSDPQTRLAAILALSEMPNSNGLGQQLYTLSQEETVQKDAWLASATYAAATRHREGFMNTYLEEHPQYEALQAQKATMATREDADYNDTDWKSMMLPQHLERAGLNIDGVVWFRKKINIPRRHEGKEGMISLGPIDESDETWVNGVKVGSTKDDWAKVREYAIPANVLKAGENTIAVRMVDNRGWGGFTGEPDQLLVKVGNKEMSLAGEWHYDVEKEFKDGGTNMFEGDVTVASLLMDTYWNKPEVAAVAEAETETENEEAIIVQIKTVKNAMKYDVGEFVVEAGKPIKIIFENPDFMQHNLLIIQPGTLETVGAAADKLASDPQGAEQQYVPDMEEVLFHTPLVDPGSTAEITFTAPENPDEYPFVCTFPGHWRIMQGTMKVVKPEAI